MVSASKLSLHTKTNISVTEKFLDAKFVVTETNGIATILCKGVGFRY